MAPPQGTGGWSPDARTLLRVLVATAAAATFLALLLSGSIPSSERVRELGEDLGWAGPLLWPALFGVLNLMVPWAILAGASGLLFGTAVGTGLALAGIMVASSLQFTIARTGAGEPLRRRLLARVPRLDSMLQRNGFLTIFYSRIVPGLAWGPVNYAAGVARVRLRDLLLATVAGGTPKVFAYVALGGNLDDLSRPEARVAIAVMVVLAVVGLTIARRQFAARAAPGPS